MGFTRAELESFRDVTVEDLIGDDPRLVFVGINPGLWTAATQTHFAHPGNRFYPALLQAGIIDREVDRSAGFTAEDRRHLLARGIAITNLVMRATVRASELTPDELRMGGALVRDKIARWNPQVVAFAGITAFRQAYRQPRAGMGRQPERWGETDVWVVPNPSGLNAHETVESLAGAYRDAAVAAGVVVTL
ncbi:MAG TPA: G/U mismatch-specific DNA glycosylase [Acidimicrobiia bacterium]|nr:G/U mismatch-specific DNA glycosylase [Acidimicrobiia bacterium]